MLNKQSLLVEKLFRFPLFLLLLTYSIKVNAGDSLFYDIKIKLQGVRTQKAVLGFYLGDQTYFVDSTQIDIETGAMRFKPDRSLAEGVYFVATNNEILFDLILAGETDITIVTKLLAPYDSADITGSRENVVFFDYMRIQQKTHKEVIQTRSTIDMLRRAKADRADIYEQQVKIRDKYEFLEQYTQNLITQNPSLLTSRLLNMTITQHVPPDILPILENKKPNPAYWVYFRQHFFDGVDFTDSRLLRSQYYIKRLEQFLGCMSTNPEEVKAQFDFVLEKTRINPDFYRYTLQWLTAIFDNNLDKMHNADAYLVHLVEKYHKNLDSGTDSYTLQKLEEKVNILKKSLIGSPAPLFSLPDTEGVNKGLSDIHSDYTLLIFFSSFCTNCRTMIPRIQNSLLYTNNSNLKIFTVCTDAEHKPWLTFLNEMNMKEWVNVIDTKTDSELQKEYFAANLPAIYLLDKNKNIIANRIKPEKLPDLLRGISEANK